MADLLADDVLTEPPHPGLPLTDEELTALALAADPDAPLPEDAVPLPFAGASDDVGLPAWYLPAPARVVRTRARVVAAIAVVAGLVVINALGLCITYGQLTAG